MNCCALFYQSQQWHMQTFREFIFYLIWTFLLYNIYYTYRTLVKSDFCFVQTAFLYSVNGVLYCIIMFAILNGILI